MTNTINSLITQANAILDKPLPLQELVDLLAQYTEEFEAWFTSYIPKGDPKEEEILVLHERLIFVAQRVMERSPAELANLKRKGKGIIAYTDILPRRVSLITSKKG